MPSPRRAHLLGPASLVSLMTLLSRITGLLQTRLVAAWLGAGPVADAFTVAYRLPNLLRRFTAEGSLTAAFVPSLVEEEAACGKDGARLLAARFLGTVGVLVVALCVVAMFAMAALMGLQMIGRVAEPGASAWAQLQALGAFLAGRRDVAWDVRLSIDLARLMFPYLGLVTLTAGISAVLNLRSRFGLAASVSTFYNLAFVAFGWVCLQLDDGARLDLRRAAFWFALATLVGGIAQLAVLWPTYRSLGYGIRWGLHLKSPGVRRILVRMGPGLLGPGIAPLNVFVSTLLASHLARGAQTVLVNANMMGEFALGLFSVSIATVSLPVLSRHAEAGDLDGLRGQLAVALRGTGLFILPAAVGLGVLAEPICALLFRTGRYDAAAVAWTASTLAFQVLGLPFIAANRGISQALYALKDYRSPAFCALAMLILNIVLTVLLMDRLGTRGVSLANALASVAGALLQAFVLSRRLKQPPFGTVLRGWGAFLVGAAAMGFLLHILIPGCGLRTFRGALPLALRLFPLIGLGAALYAGLLLAFRVPEALDLGRWLLGKLGRKPSAMGE